LNEQKCKLGEAKIGWNSGVLSRVYGGEEMKKMKCREREGGSGRSRAKEEEKGARRL